MLSVSLCDLQCRLELLFTAFRSPTWHFILGPFSNQTHINQLRTQKCKEVNFNLIDTKEKTLYCFKYQWCSAMTTCGRWLTGITATWFFVVGSKWTCIISWTLKIIFVLFLMNVLAPENTYLKAKRYARNLASFVTKQRCKKLFGTL